MSKPNGIIVLIPTSGRNVCIEWAAALASLSYPVGMNHFLYISKADPDAGHTRAEQREMLADIAVKINAEFMMWVDDDTVIPATTVQELFYVLSQNPKAMICGGIYCTKSHPAEPIVFLELGGGPHWQWTMGDIFPCAGLGTGCMMVRTSVLKDLPKPWFQDTSKATPGETEVRNGQTINVAARTGTDDLYFCKKVSPDGAASGRIIAHGGVLPVHVDYSVTPNVPYKLPKNSHPVISYQEKLDAVNATLPEGKKQILL
jgi:hypothetical protein